MLLLLTSIRWPADTAMSGIEVEKNYKLSSFQCGAVFIVLKEREEPTDLSKIV